MRNISLICILFLFNCNILFAQKTVTPTRTTDQSKVKQILDNHFNNSKGNILKHTRKPAEALPSSLGTKERVGFSTYDLQTNGSMQRRLLQTGSNLSVCWTYSNELSATPTSAYADRGTGYAYFNGTNWTPHPNARIEPVRTGFPSIAIDGNNNEVIAVHDGNNNIHLSRKNGAAWTTTQLGLNNSYQALWPHMATSGNWMYLVTSSIDSNIHTNGIRNGYFFSRSNDNGATWIDNMIPMPLIDSVGHYRGGGNSYAISAQGSNVAILFGDMATDLTLISSNDYGATWTKKVIFDWPLNNFNFAAPLMTDVNNDNIPDTLYTNDGSQSMAMDAMGNVHIAFPVVRVYKTGANTGYNFFYTTYLAYYNSIFDSIQIIDNIFYLHHDCDNDNQFGIGANYTGNTAQTPGAIYNTIGTLSMPSVTVVSGNPQKIIIAYTTIMDGDTTEDDFSHPEWIGSSNYTGQNYRDVMVMISPDNGNIWNPYPVNISKTSHFEEAFVSAPELISGSNYNVYYQGDKEPGTIMQNEDQADDIHKNFQIVQSIPISQLLTLSMDSTAPCGQNDLPLGIKNILNAKDGNIMVYPNPSNDVVNIDLQFLNTQNAVTIELVDIYGKVILTEKLLNVKSQKTHFYTHHLASGMYNIKVNTDDGSITIKLIKE